VGHNGTVLGCYQLAKGLPSAGALQTLCLITMYLIDLLVFFWILQWWYWLYVIS